MTSGTTRSGQRVSIFPHNDRAGLSRCEDHLAARKAAITAVRTNDGDLIEIDTNLGPIGGGAGSPTCHCVLSTQLGEISGGPG
jgi:hypothetical protein